jgi:hypothetical protein
MPETTSSHDMDAQQEAPTAASPDFNEWNLEPNAEYRFELEHDSSLAIKV